MNSPLVSVIIPFYNPPNIPIAIQSILSQSYQNFELILVDNNSSIKYLKSINRFLTDQKVSLIKESNQGVVHAMNAGIRYANGDFIMRMDADDISDPLRIKKQLQAFAKDPTLGVVSGMVTYKGHDRFKGFKHYVSWLNTIVTSQEITLNQFVELPLVNPSLIFRKQVFERYGLFKDGNFPEDYELFLRLQQHKVKMAKVPFNVLTWIDSDHRLTRTDSRYSVDAFYRIKSKYLSYWLEKNNPFHPNIHIWGAGKLSKKRSKYLLNYGIKITGYIDVVKKAWIIHYEDVPNDPHYFIVSYVSNRGAREKIREFLSNKGYEEGVNFILAS